MSLEKTLVEKVRTAFHEKFKAPPAALFRAPGRVNLIGEHTDYNGGFVLPMAIERSIVVALRPNGREEIRVFSLDLGEEAVFSARTDVPKMEKGHWTNYARGVTQGVRLTGGVIPGADIAFAGDVPRGAGLSSSAAVEVAFCFALLHLAGKEMPRTGIAKLCQKAEHDYAGVRCGIMDQSISALGKKDMALFLDCRSLEYRHVPLPSDRVRVVICHTGVSRGLSSSEYNRRRSECEQAAQAMNSPGKKVSELRDASVEDVDRIKGRVPDVVFKRARHVVGEIARTERAAEALQKGDVALFGKLANESHDSLRDDYEVSCRELDLMVAIARSCKGVYGARMTGAGFGGCTVNFVDLRQVDSFSAVVSHRYETETGLKPEIYVSAAADGAGTI